jgi:hypothetical protein
MEILGNLEYKNNIRLLISKLKKETKKSVWVGIEHSFHILTIKCQERHVSSHFVQIGEEEKVRYWRSERHILFRKKNWREEKKNTYAIQVLINFTILNKDKT